MERGVQLPFPQTALSVTSRCRREAHNRKCGGVPSSQHLRGTAADIRIEGGHRSKLPTMQKPKTSSPGGNTVTHAQVIPGATLKYESITGKLCLSAASVGGECECKTISDDK